MPFQSNPFSIVKTLTKETTKTSLETVRVVEEEEKTERILRGDVQHSTGRGKEGEVGVALKTKSP